VFVFIPGIRFEPDAVPKIYINCGLLLFFQLDFGDIGLAEDMNAVLSSANSWIHLRP